jgi:hypothetical protein
LLAWPGSTAETVFPYPQLFIVSSQSGDTRRNPRTAAPGFWKYPLTVVKRRNDSAQQN